MKLYDWIKTRKTPIQTILSIVKNRWYMGVLIGMLMAILLKLQLWSVLNILLIIILIESLTNKNG